jgi:hypothetical protein
MLSIYSIMEPSKPHNITKCALIYQALLDIVRHCMEHGCKLRKRRFATDKAYSASSNHLPAANTLSAERR